MTLPGGGRYQVLRELGRGGMGIVYAARDQQLDREVALKVLSGPAAKHVEGELEREALALARGTHPHLVRVLDWVSAPAPAFLVMELIEGESLAARLARVGPLGEAEVIRLARQLASAIDSLHDEGMLHRDIKPGNVMLRGGSDDAVLMDLGLVKDLDRTTLTATGTLLGTPRYIPPEVLGGDRWTAAADLYQLGALLREAATGTPMVPGTTLKEVCENVLAEVRSPWPDRAALPCAATRQAIERAVAMDPGDRFLDCSALAARLPEVAVDRPGAPAPVIPPPEVPPARGGSRRALAALLLSSALGAAAFHGSRPVPGPHLPPEDAPGPGAPATAFASPDYPRAVLRELSATVRRGVDPDPLRWPTLLEELPRTRSFLTWIEAGGDPRELPDAARRDLRSLDRRFETSGLPAPFSPFAGLPPTAPPESSLLGPRCQAVAPEATAALAGPLGGWTGEAVRTLEELLGAVARLDEWVATLAPDEVPPGYVPGLLRSLGRSSESLVRFQEATLQLRQNRIAARAWLAAELDLQARSLVATGLALEEDEPRSDGLAVLVSEALNRLRGLAFEPRLLARPLAALGGLRGSPGGDLVRGHLLIITRELCQRYGIPEPRAGGQERKLLEHALRAPGAGLASRRRRALAANLLWMRGASGGEPATRPGAALAAALSGIGPEEARGLAPGLLAAIQGATESRQKAETPRR